MCDFDKLKAFCGHIGACSTQYNVDTLPLTRKMNITRSCIKRNILERVNNAVTTGNTFSVDQLAWEMGLCRSEIQVLLSNCDNKLVALQRIRIIATHGGFTQSAVREVLIHRDATRVVY